MNRGTTPHFTFTLPFDTSIIDTMRIYFEQDGERIITKQVESCTFNGNEILVNLTQEETLLFQCNKYARVQLHILTVTQEALVSDIKTIYVGECLGDEVLS